VLRCRWLPSPGGGLTMSWAEEIEDEQLPAVPARPHRPGRLLVRAARIAVPRRVYRTAFTGKT
jgi:hypothetical protein